MERVLVTSLTMPESTVKLKDCFKQMKTVNSFASLL
jgi:hypothetical protein